jgi:hypothetical protein
VAGDLNSRTGNKAAAKIISDNGEPVINHNGQNPTDFAAVNGLKITNSFFRHKHIHKYTLQIYVLTNRKTSPLVQDTRVY